MRCWCGLLLVLPGLLHAQGLRDPMQMPGSLRAPSGTSTSHGMGSSHPEPTISEGAPLHRFDGPLSVLRINGEPQLVVGTRLMGVGQMLGGERIERISETNVWLRAGTQTRKLALFEGVQRTSHPCPGAHKACEGSPP